MHEKLLPITFTSALGKSVLLKLWALLMTAMGVDVSGPERAPTFRARLAFFFKSLAFALLAICMMVVVAIIKRDAQTPALWLGGMFVGLCGLIMLWIVLFQRMTLRLDSAGLHYQRGKTIWDMPWECVADVRIYTTNVYGLKMIKLWRCVAVIDTNRTVRAIQPGFNISTKALAGLLIRCQIVDETQTPP